MFLDMKTVFFSYVITDVVCAVFLVFLWVRNRQRFAGLSLWVVHYVMQVASLLLILMRGMAPDFLSIVVANSLSVGGAMALFMGLERFVGKVGRQIHNVVFLSAFVLAHAYFTYVQPDLDARIINVSLGILVFSVQGAWLLFRRVETAMRPVTRGMGMVLGAYCGVGLLRIILVLAGGRTGENFFESSAFDPIMVLIYQMLFIVATYSLAMMVNRRLTGDIQTQEERFRSMVEFSSDWDYWVGPDGNVLYTTPSCEALTGYRPKDFLQDPELRNRIVHPDDQAAFRTHEDGISAVSGPQSLDFRIVTRTGETRWLNHMCRQVYDSKGRRLGRVAGNRDVTERQQMERQLLEAREDWESIFHAVGHFTLILSPDQRILAVNRMGEKLIGRPTSEMIGKQCYEVFHGSATPPAGCPFSAMQRDGRITAAEMEVETLNRSYIVSCTPVLDGAGHLDKVIHVATDITDRRLADKALRKSQERLLEAQRIAGMGDFTWDVETGEVSWSEGLSDLLGYDSSETIDYARVNAAIHHPDDLARVTRWLNDAIASGKDELSPNEYRVIRKDGGTLFIRTIGRIRHRQGKKPVIFATVQDITDIRKAEEEREKLQDQLTQAQKMESVGRLAGGVAHDFNNKLSTILGYTELAMGELDKSAPLYGNLEQVLKAGTQSAAIVRQLLAFARKQIIAPEPIYLNDTVEGMLKMLRRLIGEDIDLKWKPDTDLWLIHMDSAQIDQILANLCVNARDAIAGVGKITIETQNAVFDEAFCRDHAGFVPGEFVMLAVSDNGCGMDRETLANAFEPFFTTKGVDKGTGLGLSTVYGIVKQNQGFVNIYSEPGKGTTFKIYLPRHAGEGEKGTHEIETEVPSGRGETILLVEDEASVLGLARRILETLGYEVMTSMSPETAVEMAREHMGEIHLLITDVVLPEMNGKDLAMTIKTTRPGIRTLYMSGYTADVIAHHGVLDDGVHFVEKPFTPRSLGRKVRKALESEK